MTLLFVILSFCIGGIAGLLVGCVLSSRRIQQVAEQKALLAQRLQELIATTPTCELMQAD